jgi:hypothetical protein
MTGGVRIMRRITQATAVGILLPLMACSKVDLSGTYLASDPNMAMMLQLEEAPDNRISGRLSFLTLDSGGRIESATAAVTGAADGSALTLTVQSVPSLPVATTLSGNQSAPGRLTLNGPAKDGQVQTWTWEQSTFFVFQTLAQNLRTRSADILKKSAEEKK